MLALRATALVAAALTLPGCGTATAPQSEELSDPGPRDASEDRALSFDGVNDYASVGTANAPQIERPQSMLLWLRAAEASPADADLQVLFALRRDSSSGIVLALDHGVPLVYNVQGPRDFARADRPISRAVWHHWAYVVEADRSVLYLDGVQAVEGVVAATNRTPTLAFIGSIDGFQNFYHGDLDELEVYDRALGPDEVATIAAGLQKPDEAEPLVIDLPFDELGGARCYDRSGSGNHAELGDGVPSAMPTRIASGIPN